jgi:hypothetical protein
MMNSSYANKECGTFRTLGYIGVKINNILYKQHRIIWKLYYGEEPNVIDHINGIKSDNRICNLRNITQKENCNNIVTIRSNNNSGYNGVHFSKKCGKWESCVNEKFLGYFNSPEEAALARELKLVEVLGEDFYYSNKNNITLIKNLVDKVDAIKDGRVIEIKTISTNTSGYTGCSYREKYSKWASCIKRDGALLNLGMYDSVEEAAIVRELKFIEYYGEAEYEKLGRNLLLKELIEKINIEVLLDYIENRYTYKGITNIREGVWLVKIEHNNKIVYRKCFDNLNEAYLNRKEEYFRIKNKEMNELESVVEKLKVLK